MQKKTIASIALLLIAVVIAVVQGVLAKTGIEMDGDTIVDRIEESEVIEEWFDEEGEGGVVTDVVATNALVTHVVDGDTIDVIMDDGLEARIRLLGVNTPETVDPRKTVECFGTEASNYAKEMLSGRRILLEADPQADERDRYGRLLRNVLLSDGTDVNALLVSAGYAYAYVRFPMDPERKVELTRLEQEAQIAKRGLWSPDACASP
ncbi:hypothetical protein GF380_05670 [Candidatus Uhrbacteria bacterium]|nr:hypothetical protein [Candidatus Uhrbacteria bacterium]MBD3284489.1 hypothetical protein [Candidatus Uhrbacteria bacterium]